MILVVTNGGDVTADFLTAQFQRDGISFARLNTEEVPQRASVELQVGTDDGGLIMLGGRRVPLAAVTSVWWRRPVAPVIADTAPKRFRPFLINETATAIGGILRTLPVLWVNHPETNFLAGFKPYQLVRAKQFGWHVPRSAITSSPTVAAQFIRELDEPPVIKAIDQGFIEAADGEAFSAFARQVNADDLASLDSVSVCPVFLQERIRKRKEYRVTVVGDSVFATTISNIDDYPVPLDWRAVAQDQLRYEPANLPAAIESKCRETVRGFGLSFGALDLLETTDGTFVFLEVNPNGQWAWIEMSTHQPIGAAMCKLLTSPEG